MKPSDIATELAAAEAAHALKTLNPTLATLAEGIESQAFRAIRDGKLTGECAVALWNRLLALEDVRSELASKAVAQDSREHERFREIFPDGVLPA